MVRIQINVDQCTLMHMLKEREREREGERERERERKRKRKSAKKVQRDEGRDTYECYENVHLSLSLYSIAPACTCDR